MTPDQTFALTYIGLMLLGTFCLGATLGWMSWYIRGGSDEDDNS